jgi:hypothetical protein
MGWSQFSVEIEEEHHQIQVKHHCRYALSQVAGYSIPQLSAQVVTSKWSHRNLAAIAQTAPSTCSKPVVHPSFASEASGSNLLTRVQETSRFTFPACKKAIADRRFTLCNSSCNAYWLDIRAAGCLLRRITKRFLEETFQNVRQSLSGHMLTIRKPEPYARIRIVIA